MKHVTRVHEYMKSSTQWAEYLREWTWEVQTRGTQARQMADAVWERHLTEHGFTASAAPFRSRMDGATATGNIGEGACHTWHGGMSDGIG